MRRVQIAVVMLALLATPLALLSRAMACESTSCPMMCCLPHGSHSVPSMPCHCSGKSQKQLPEFGLIAPIAPTMTEEFATVGVPDSSRQPLQVRSASLAKGFAAAPFNPPRS
ncbi:MAG TPA: hypothetical protein VEJ38_15560 [Candidatus Acidoferrales bacterium]|nr:hypothetical protein [Candidatus Acidoferrales bacterium]